MEHRAMIGMGPGARDAGEIMETLYTLRGIDEPAFVRHNLNVLRMEVFFFF
jgi:hypothetical protein